MKAIDVARKVASEKQAHVFRQREGHEPGQPLEYDAKPWGSGRKGKGWTLLDGWTASTIVQVYDGANEANRAKLDGLTLTRLAAICLKVANS